MNRSDEVLVVKQIAQTAQERVDEIIASAEREFQEMEKAWREEKERRAAIERKRDETPKRQVSLEVEVEEALPKKMPRVMEEPEVESEEEEEEEKEEEDPTPRGKMMKRLSDGIKVYEGLDYGDRNCLFDPRKSAPQKVKRVPKSYTLFLSAQKSRRAIRTADRSSAWNKEKAAGREKEWEDRCVELQEEQNLQIELGVIYL